MRIHTINVYTTNCEETQLHSCKNNVYFSIFSEIYWFSLVKHTQINLVAEQNTYSVGKLTHSQFRSAFVDFYLLCVKNIQFSKVQILERRKCRPHYILRSWGEQLSNWVRTNPNMTKYELSSLSVQREQRPWTLRVISSCFQNDSPMHAILAPFCVKIASV